MKATQKFLFVYENNYINSTLPAPDTQTPNLIQRNVRDRFRQVIGNYWFPRLPNGRVDATPPNGFTPGPTETAVNPNSNLAWGENKLFPFKVKLGRTHYFSTSKTIPTLLTTTPVTLVADRRFGAYPECSQCWFRYLYGFEETDPNKTFSKVYGFEPLRLQEIESSISMLQQPVGTPSALNQRIGSKMPLAILLIGDVGLPTTQRLSEIGVDISYLSYGKALENAILSMSGPITRRGSIAQFPPRPPELEQTEIPKYTLNVNVKIFRDTYFDNEIATLTDVEQNKDSTIDFSLNATVEFVHNYTAREYEKYLMEDPNNIGLNDFGGERKLANMYEWIYNERLQPTIIKLRTDLNCFAQNLAVFFRSTNTSVIYTLAETVSLINKFYPFQTLMPYYSRINFNLQSSGPITAATQETRNDGLIMRHMQENRGIEGAAEFRTFKQSGMTSSSRGRTPSLMFAENRDLIRYWEYYEWLLKLRERISNAKSSLGSSLIANPLVDYLPQESIIINKGSITARYTTGEDNRRGNIAYDISTKAIHGKISDIIRDYHRTYPELLKGSKPHKEVIAYRVAKYSNENLSNRGVTNSNQQIGSSGFLAVEELDRVPPLQEFWFFNTKQEEVVNYIDTQIMSDRYYTYVAYAYVVVLDSEYYYTNVGNLPKTECEDKYMDFGFEPGVISQSTGPVVTGGSTTTTVQPLMAGQP